MDKMVRTPSDVLSDLYHDPKSKLFLVKDSQKLYEAAKNDSLQSNITHLDVELFKQKVESIAQSNALKRPGGNSSRRFSFRKYKLYNSNTLIGDICFLPRLTGSNDPQQSNMGSKKKVLLVLMCAFSRKVSLNFMNDATASSTLQTFEKALKEDFPGKTFTKFQSDRGYVYLFKYCSIPYMSPVKRPPVSNIY